MRKKVYVIKYRDDLIEFHLEKNHAHDRALQLSNHSVDKEHLSVEAYYL